MDVSVAAPIFCLLKAGVVTAVDKNRRYVSNSR